MNHTLQGTSVIELAGIGPGPHVAMMLADLGASVTRIERPGSRHLVRTHTLRGRRVIEADLKDPTQLAQVKTLVQNADVLIEGFRPGVATRLGLGPDDFTEVNPGLVYLSLTGWGQTGPYAQAAGHDINYLSITGALHAIGTADQSVPPLNLLGDFGGGAMFGLAGVLAALLERTRSGRGQHVDAAMVDGVSVLSQHVLELRAEGIWSDERASNILDGGAPYYRTYVCADGLEVAVGAIEPQFYALLLDGLGLSATGLPDQDDTAAWPGLHATFAAMFARRTRDDWATVFAGTDACVTPVLTFTEAAQHAHMSQRRAITVLDGHEVAGVAPRLSRSGI